MSLLSPIFEKRDLKLSDPKAYSPSLWNLYGRMGHSGVVVTEQTAMTSGAVWACVKLISDTISSLPFKLYEKQPDGGKKEVTEKNVLRVLKRPNREMPGFRLLNVQLGHLMAWGNFFCAVLRDNVGRVVELWPLRPDRMTMRRDPNTHEIYYEYKTEGEPLLLSRRDCWHVPGFGYDGMQGYSVINQAREGIALGMAAEEYGSRFFGQGASPGVVVRHPGKISPEAHQSMREDMQEKIEGLGKAHRLMLLEEGMEAQTLGMQHDDMQFLETRKFQVTEVCRFFRVPPHMVFDLERSTFSNIEHQEIEFVTHSIRPWCVLIEQEAAHYFLTPAERQRLFFEFKLQGLLRGDTPSRYEAYQKAIFSGWMKPNEARALENLNPEPELDFFAMPMNYVPVEQFVKEPEPIPAPLAIAPVEEEETEEEAEEKSRQFRASMRLIAGVSPKRMAGGRHRIATSYKRLFRNAAKAVVHREMEAVRRAVTRYLSERSVGEFDKWLDDFYGGLPEYIQKKFRGVVQSFAEQIHAAAAKEIGADEAISAEMQKFIDDYLSTYSDRHVGKSVLQLKRLIDRTEAAEMSEIVLTRLDEWGEKRADKIAAEETVRGNGAFTRQTFILAGITTLTWVATGGKPCPYCQELDGKIVGIQNSFVSKGDFQPEGQEPMAIKSNHFHPPLHGGCLCSVVAG